MFKQIYENVILFLTSMQYLIMYYYVTTDI